MNGFSQMNWGSGFGLNSSSGWDLTGRINFDYLEYKVQTRFEKKVDEMSYEGDYRMCNKYMDKKVQKGKLTPNELSLVYYMKCRLYSDIIYDYWGFSNERGNIDFDDSNYPFSENHPINHTDSIIRYSKLFLNSTDPSSSIYEFWLGYVYNSMSSTITYEIDTLLENVVNDKHYYNRNTAECDAHLERIHFLKSTVDYFHPVNWLAFDLIEFRYKHSLGLSTKVDEEKIKQQVADYLLNRSRWEEKRGIALNIPVLNKYQELYGYDHIELEFQKLLKHLYTSDLVLAHQLLKECPQVITNRFAEINNYASAWEINKNSSLSNPRLIDLRDSTDLKSSTFSICTTIEIVHDIPTGDTVIIDGVRLRSNWDSATLVEPIEITGKGTSSLTIKTTHRIPPENEVYTYSFSSDDLQLVSNRGFRNVAFRMNAIGRRQE